MADVDGGSTPGVIGGRYKTVRLIGRGGMGSVWQAKDALLGRQVAVKQIGALPGETEREAERAMREARSAAALNHPNMVALYDAIKHEGEPWLVMEYVSGPTLAAWVREHGPLEPEAVAEIGARLASGLAAAHRAGIVHRDIKPANVFMADDGEPKIGDFGTARGASDDDLTLAGVVTGTPSYMAPEVADGGEHAEAADVWALGATLYFAVEGQDAYPGSGNALATLRTIATKPPRTPERAGLLEPVLAQMLSHTPSRRGSMHEVMRRLEAIAPGRPGAIPMTGAGAAVGGAAAGGAAAAAGGAAAAGAGEDEETVARFVGPEGEEPPGLFGFAPEPERKRRKDKAAPLLIGLAAAWVIGALGVVAFALDNGTDDEATPPTTTSTSSESSSTSSTSSTTSTTREPTSETTTEEVVPPPPPPPTTQAPPPQPTSEPPPPPQTSEPPPPETTTTPEPTETTSESSSESTSESSSESSTSTTSEPSETEPSSSSSMTTEPPPSTTSEPSSPSPTSSESSSRQRSSPSE